MAMAIVSIGVLKRGNAVTGDSNVPKASVVSWRNSEMTGGKP